MMGWTSERFSKPHMPLKMGLISSRPGPIASDQLESRESASWIFLKVTSCKSMLGHFIAADFSIMSQPSYASWVG